MNNELIALYEIKRQAFLIGYIENPERYSDALAYAYYHRVSPIFHEQSARETYGTDPFEEVYAVKTEFMEEVLDFVDKCDLDKNYSAIEFRSLEDRFGGYKANRIELIFTLEYARIDGRFDKNVWDAIKINAPLEAHHISATFSPLDVEFS